VSDDPQPTGNVLTATDVTALVSLMSGMLDRMESRIIARLDDNSRGASERWAKHDAELATSTARVVKRFEGLEVELLTVSNCLKGHLDKEHDEDLVSDARVRPVKSLGRWLATNWKDILISLLGVLVLLGVLGIEWRAVQ
jgi:hypothetical protein